MSFIHLIAPNETRYFGDAIRVTAMLAGHVLGAVQFQIHLGSTCVLYTGDYSREEDRHLAAAALPRGHVDVLLIESTFGVSIHEPVAQRERHFLAKITEVVERGGKCLVPVVAIGRV